MITRLIWIIWTSLSAVPRKAVEFNHPLTPWTVNCDPVNCHQCYLALLPNRTPTCHKANCVVRLCVHMMMSSNGNIFSVTVLCAGNSPVTGESPSRRPVTRSFYIFFDLCLNKRLSKQSIRRWLETQSRSLRRHCNDGRVLHNKKLQLWGCFHFCYFTPNLIVITTFQM